MEKTTESKLSVILLTSNEEVSFPSCLESFRGLDCENFMADSGSTDRTLKIIVAIGIAAGQTVDPLPLPHHLKHGVMNLAWLPGFVQTTG